MTPSSSCRCTYKTSFPFPWYGDRKLFAITALVIYLLAEGVVLLLPKSLFPPVALTAVIIYLLGAVFDFYFTWMTLRLQPEYERRNLSFPIYETNRFLANAKSPWQIVFSVATLATVLAIPLVWYIPGLGFGVGIGRLMAGATNLTVSNDLAKNLKIIDS
jgi:hypothetical protein